MKKIRLIRTTILEFEPNPEDYWNGATLDEMAQAECEFEDKDLQFLGAISDTVRYEIIE